MLLLRLLLLVIGFGQVLSLAAPIPNAIEKGHVYYVATPLGNLQDVTARAAHILANVDVICAEDTRTTRKLLNLLGLNMQGRQQLIAHHEHNWQESTPGVLQLLRDGKSVAVVSDAGTPGISDPGTELAAACADARIPIHPVPGPSAVIAALSVCGFPCVPFTFHGFVAARGRERGDVLQNIMKSRSVGVFFEAPHRVAQTMRALASLVPEWGDRRVLVCRELTKQHEELWRGTLDEAATWLEGKAVGLAAEGDVDAAGALEGEPQARGLLQRRAFKSKARAAAIVESGGIRGEFTIVVGPPEKEGIDTRSYPGQRSGDENVSARSSSNSISRRDNMDNGDRESNSQAAVRIQLSALRADGVSRSEAVMIVAGEPGKSAGAKGRKEVYRVALDMDWG